MKGSDRIVLIALPAIALVAAFWFLVLSPKRDEASSLQTDVETLEGEVAELEQTIANGEQARRDFPADYKKVVVLGKAVPADDDQASLFAQLSGISAEASVEFRTLEVFEGGDSAAAASGAAAPPTTEQAPAAPPEGEGGSTEEAPAATPATATEATAATLPIGATLGPAGLPVMPYKLDFRGSFFHLADFLHGLDGTVGSDDGQVKVDGRLLTVNGFSLTGDPEKGFPSLLANFAVTAYITPPDQGLTGGATPAGPVPTTGTPSTVSTGEAAPSTGTAGTATTGAATTP
jgi:hypothetical protein